MVGREIKGKVKIHRRGPRSRRENHACGMAGIRFIHEFVLPWELFLSLFLVGFSASPRTSAVKVVHSGGRGRVESVGVGGGGGG